MGRCLCSVCVSRGLNWLREMERSCLESPPLRAKTRARFEWALFSFYDVVHNSRECHCMAKKSASKNGDWKGYANIPFNAEARGEYERGAPVASDVYRWLEEAIATGYRVTLSYDSRNDALQCSMTCQNERDPNYGYTLTSRGPTWFDALSVCLFKHNVLAEREWPLSEKTTGDKWG